LTDENVVHDPDYRAALQDFTTFLEQLSEKVSTIDETIPELPVKDLVSFLIPTGPLMTKAHRPADLPYLSRYEHKRLATEEKFTRE
jgi:hypothetical protein